jgi:hypothetical protein
MRLNRTLLYTGVFLLAIGAALAVADLGQLTTAALTDALRLWPLAVIAIGLGIALRRTQAGLATGLLAAALPGLILGSAMATAPRLAMERGTWDALEAAYTRYHYCEEADVHIDFGNVQIDPIGGCR